jgi:protein involved in polysaccharide export with SLBB domain
MKTSNTRYCLCVLLTSVITALQAEDAPNPIASPTATPTAVSAGLPLPPSPTALGATPTAAIPSPASRSADDARRARKIAVNDILAIRVVGEPELSREVKVDGDGRIEMLYVGSVQVVGRSPADVAAEIRDALDRDWIINPQVAVDIKQYDVHYVTVMGAVNRAQQVQIIPDHRMDVLEAIGGAGDFSRDADKEGITLRRAATGQVLRLKNRELIRVTDPNQRIYVEPGDVINVERTIF